MRPYNVQCIVECIAYECVMAHRARFSCCMERVVSKSFKEMMRVPERELLGPAT